MPDETPVPASDSTPAPQADASTPPPAQAAPPSSAPASSASDVQSQMAPFIAKEQAATQKASDIAGQSTAPPPPGPHARLLGMIQGLALGLDSFGKSIGTGGKEGGVPEVQQVRAEQQQQKIQAQQARDAQKNAQIQQQLMVADTNHKLAQNVLFMHTIPNELAKSDLEVSGARQAQAIAGAEFSKANWGLTPDQVSGKAPLTSQNLSSSQSMLSRTIGDENRGAMAILGKDDPAVIEAVRVSKNPNPTAQEISAAGQGLVIAQQQSAATAEARTKQEAASVNAPFGAKADALNSAMTDRYQVLNPGKALPDNLKLDAKSTPKDFDRVDKILQQTENAQGTKANRDVVNGMRETMLNLAKGGAIPGDETKDGDEYVASLPTGLAATIKAIHEGREAPPPAGSRSAAAQSILGALNHAYPDYDATKYPSYAALRKDFTSGKTSVGINSFNTALSHLGRMYDHISALTTLPGVSGAAAALGSEAAAALKSDKQAVSMEIAKAYANGQATQGEVNDWNKKLDVWSPVELKNNIKEIVPLMGGKLDAYTNQWSNGVPAAGIVTPITIVTPSAQATMDRIAGKATNNSSGKAVSLAAAMQLPINKGKTEAEVRADIISHGHQVGQ